MNYRKLILDVIHGRPTECIPFVPRLDLWYRANKGNGTLPTKYKNATLMDITEDLGVGYHAIIPNFQDLRGPDDDVDRALGIYNLWFMPYKTILNNIKRRVEKSGDTTSVEYLTPKGLIKTSTTYDVRMRAAGITITHINKYAAQTVSDLEVLGYIYENATVEANYAGFEQFQSDVGDAGAAVAYMIMGASPIHLIQRDLMPFDMFCFMLYDHPQEMATLAQKMQKYFDRILEILCGSNAQMVLLGANYDVAWTNPPFFKEHITPALSRQADILHNAGKLLLTHTDGENTGLLEEYVNCKIDVADSICPAPMTKLSLKEVRDVFGKKITIWGGIPSISVLEESMSDKEFYNYIDSLFEQIGRGDHLIFSIADTTPPTAKFSRIEYLIKRIREFGKVA